MPFVIYVAAVVVALAAATVVHVAVPIALEAMVAAVIRGSTLASHSARMEENIMTRRLRTAAQVHLRPSRGLEDFPR